MEIKKLKNILLKKLISVLEKNKHKYYNKSIILIGDDVMSAKDTLKDILKEKKITQVELAEKINSTKQNLSNKLNRDNFSTIELVEIADALNMELILKCSKNNKEYKIDYPEDQKWKPKRKSAL